MRMIEAIYLRQVPLINSSPLSIESVNFIHAWLQDDSFGNISNQTHS